MEQKEQTKCMGSDGMQKMNGVINADLMTVEEIHQKLDAGYKDMENGRVREASEVFAKSVTALGFYKQYGVSVELCSQVAGITEKEFLSEVKRSFIG